MSQQDLSGVHLWLIMIKAFHSVAAYARLGLRDSGFGDSDFRVMEVLLHKGPTPVNAIGPRVFLTTGSISTAVDRLHRKGMVTRIVSPSDRRVHIVDLTAEGRALIAQVFEDHSKALEELASVLSPSERVHLIDSLKKLGKNAEERLLT